MKLSSASGIKTQPVKKVASKSALGTVSGAAVGSATGAVPVALAVVWQQVLLEDSRDALCGVCLMRKR